MGGVTRDLGDGRLGSKTSGIWEIGVKKIRDLGDWGKIWDIDKISGRWEIGVQKIRDMGDWGPKNQGYGRLTPLCHPPHGVDDC